MYRRCKVAADRVRHVVERLGHEHPLAARRTPAARGSPFLGGSWPAATGSRPSARRLRGRCAGSTSAERAPAPCAPRRSANCLQPREVPRVEFRQVVLAQAVPRLPLPAPRPRLLVERRPHVAVDAADHLVVVAPAVVPQPPVVIENGEALRLHFVRELIEVVGEPRPDAARHEPRDSDARPRSRATAERCPATTRCRAARPRAASRRW